jgi:Holliday junction resolvasome RuvABC ATP-dependent DNA helicase subunit
MRAREFIGQPKIKENLSIFLTVAHGQRNGSSGCFGVMNSSGFKQRYRV